MATYSTRINIKLNNQDLIEKLHALDVSDLGKGFYQAKEIFIPKSYGCDFFDGESAINEYDLKQLVARVVEIIKNEGTILAETFSYDYDPFPTVCYYTGGEIICKLLELDGYDLFESVDIRKQEEWLKFVENANVLEY